MNKYTRKASGLDPVALRSRLDGQTGPRLWRSLEELADTEEFRAFIDREFPDAASQWTDASSRRSFLRLMGASLALAGVGVGVSGCDYQAAPPEKVLPYVRQPEQLVQGKPQTYATAITLGGLATGVLVESHMGRPTMVEGNPSHPDSLGSIDYLTQASILSLYDPDRAQVVMRSNAIGTFDSFLLAASTALESQRAKKGAGVRILTETVTSPTLARQIRALLKDLPAATWHQYEPVAPHAERAGLKTALGRAVSPVYHVEKADVIVSLDADFLACGAGRLHHARGFAARREPTAGAPGMNRLYAVESAMTVTGASADHRLPLRAHDILPLAQLLARKLDLNVPEPAESAAIAAHVRFLNALAEDLKGSKGKSLLLAGASQPPYLHALVHTINYTLDNIGATVEYVEPVEAEPVDQLESMAELCKAMKSGAVEVLFVLGGNPAYTAPADLGFTAALTRVGFKARLGLYEDETSALCDWHIPEAHELEAWGDARGSDGTATIQQPLIDPLYGGRTASELIAALLRHPSRSSYEIVRDTWREKTPKEKDFETIWRTSVHNGIVAGSAQPTVKVEPRSDLGPVPAPAPGNRDAIELIFQSDPMIWDGRFSNNGWLQELPKPLTKLTWDNAALMSLAMAERLGVINGDVVALAYKGRTVDAPVMILPGHADRSVTIHFGYGRSKTGRVGTGAGFNSFALWTSDAPGFGAGLELTKTGHTHALASTQVHRNIDLAVQGRAEKDRGLVRVATLAGYREHPDFAHQGANEHEPPKDETLYFNDRTPKEKVEPDYQWGMVVNLNACTGCGACVLACQAENNSPVVGKDQVLRGREMHWMEIDRYYEGDPASPEVLHQPRLCMHCENAPCEVVCPVAATAHDHEGLNVMVYNRCVGTRYCGNNCPYKVRHFNFLQYSEVRGISTLALLNNPDVTVRARGVMEKCTYCIQRINEARYAAELDGRRIRDGEIVTACQSACPTRAIVFGDIADPSSAVSKLKAGPRNYGMLAELNTQPRTSYLAKLRNPNPALETEPRHGV
jgi:molybdopterin-containing oxidoreductase family iron-sulfur binding subunit